jgi:hypothetical protein
MIALAAATSACGQTTGAGPATPAQTPSAQQERTMKIRISSDGRTITATLADNATSREFVALLPLTLDLEDYASTEKIADLPKRLSTDGAPAAMTPRAGDITYYAPWGNLALFYKDGHHSPGLVKLGTIESVDVLRHPGRLAVTIEREVAQ